MNYPIWDAALGYGVLMGSIAVVHVFISHFAIGGGLYLVVTEHLARRRGDEALLEHLVGLSRFFVLLTLVLGALTGVGIWFVIGLLSPTGTELLIRNFVWGWAVEWTFFVVEIAAALVYYYGWKRLSARAHLAVGWVYFAAAWLSLVVINGIITFMLTPGEWSTTGSFWDGFFNPTYWSTLVLRTGVCVMLAGLYTLLVASRRTGDPLKGWLVRYDALWGLAGLAVVVPSFRWYVASMPEPLMEAARSRMPWVMTWHEQIGTLALVLAAGLVVFGLGLGRRMNTFAAALLMLVGFAWFGAFEMYRESIRKPWVVHGALYGNGIAATAVDELQEDGILAHLTYSSGDPGRDLFLVSCRSCHTLDGYKSLKAAYAGGDADLIAGTIRGAHRMTGNMPPFAGTAEEAGILAEWIAGHVDGRPLAEIRGLSGTELGREAFALRCGKCHVPGGFQDPSSSLSGLTAEDLSDFLDMAGELTEEMPPYTGDDEEREALIAHLLTLEEGGGA